MKAKEKTESICNLEDGDKPGKNVLDQRLKLFAKFINHQYAAWSALYELITSQKPPKMKDINLIISGHYFDK
jgi:hypothetical protein